MTNTGHGRCATIWTPGYDAGGEVARFGGNFFWQTRLSDDLLTQTCYKTRAEAEDPAMHGDRGSTSYWDHPLVARPAVASLGLTGSAGVYAGWSRCAAHGSGGFAIYRPDHWSLRDTGLGYGDVLGAEAENLRLRGGRHRLHHDPRPAVCGRRYRPARRCWTSSACRPPRRCRIRPACRTRMISLAPLMPRRSRRSFIAPCPPKPWHGRRAATAAWPNIAVAKGRCSTRALANGWQG